MNRLPIIEYRRDVPLEARDVARVFEASGILRPSHDLARIARMLEGANLVISAWSNGRLIGIARALTDFCYCCYLSDLAVDAAFQKRGIGKELLRRVREGAGDGATMVLISAEGAMNYYPKVGFTRSDNAFVVKRTR